MDENPTHEAASDGPADQDLEDSELMDLLQLLGDEDFGDITIPEGAEQGMTIREVLGDGSPGKIRNAVMLCNLHDIETSEGPPEQLQARDELVSWLLELIPNDASISHYTLNIAVQLAASLYNELDIGSAGRGRRGYRANHYAVALGHRYWADGDPKDLENAIILSGEAIACSETAQRILRGLPVVVSLESAHDVHILNTLAVRLTERFELSGSLSDLNRSIEITRRLIAAVPRIGWEDVHSEWLGNLSASLHRRYEQDESRSSDDLDQAVARAEEALTLSESQGKTQIATELCTLAHPLGRRALATHSIQDLDRAIALLNRAQSITPRRHVRHTEIGLNLAMRLLQKSDMVAGDAETGKAILKEALEIAKQCLEDAPADHPIRAPMENLIGMLLYAQFWKQRSGTGTGGDVRPALAHLWKALTAPQGLSVFRRVQAGRMFLTLCCATGQWSEACAGAAEAAALIPKLSSRALRNRDKQRLLGTEDVVGFGADAAAAALNAGEDGYTALRLLEVSRGSLASSIADLRTDLADLAVLQGEHLNLATRFAELRDRIQSSSLRRHSTNRDLDALLEEIRGKPGCSNFLQPPSQAEMQEAACDGPIVVLTASEFRGVDAILVERDGIRVLRLHGLTLAELEKRRSDSHMDSPELLEWLWDSIAKKVLDELKLTAPISPDGHPPRMWWVLTGMLGVFPLHAAGRRSRGSTESVMDRVASSYSTSIRALVKIRRDAASLPSSPPSKALLVGVPSAPDCRPLRYAASEIREVGNLLASKGIEIIPLEDSCVRKQDVLRHLEGCHIFHFAGHGVEYPRDPLRSALLLHDWKSDAMTVSDVLDLNLSRGRRSFLAYLSACETGLVSSPRFYDESTHLVGAYQLAGFRHVIGTLWSVYDQASVEVATLTYKNLLGGTMTDASVCRALHKAVWELRQAANSSHPIEGITDAGGRKLEISDSSEDELSADELQDRLGRKARAWVPFVHFGV